MKIENPFESGHIKNYIMAYVGVVVIMILFFIASSLWNDIEKHPKKQFEAKHTDRKQSDSERSAKFHKKEEKKLKLLEKVY